MCQLYQTTRCPLEAVAGPVASLGIHVISLLGGFACRLFKNDLTRCQANFTPGDAWLWITLVGSFCGRPLAPEASRI